MGMTINESITELEKARDSIEPCLFIDEAIDQSMKTAVETMRKYQKIQTRLNGLEHSMECLLESNPRTFTNRVCENGWLFDKIIEWRKIINEVLKDDNSNLDNSSM
jgi:hypothetical protein